MSQRTTLILFIAFMAGIGFGVLKFLSEKSYPEALIAGVVAAGGCTVGLHSLID
ncbi:hypothetical protein [Streptomyces sp. NPDC048462]|uniref:hypothetical protein n=1 Tax=Streptomyces sp. NPDC048462 TaxID=3365555 RepID=UPI003714C698